MARNCTVWSPWLGEALEPSRRSLYRWEWFLGIAGGRARCPWKVGSCGIRVASVVAWMLHWGLVQCEVCVSLSVIIGFLPPGGLMEIRRGRLGLIRGRLMQWTSQHADRWARGISLWLSGHGAGWLGEQVYPPCVQNPMGFVRARMLHYLYSMVFWLQFVIYEVLTHILSFIGVFSLFGHYCFILILFSFVQHRFPNECISASTTSQHNAL